MIDANEMFTGIIYKAVNIQNKKVYIGQTTKSLNERKKEHILYSEKKIRYFYNAIKKYGVENFKWIILGEIFSDNIKDLKIKLDEAEIECIYFYRSFGSDGENFDTIYGYNMTKGGGGNLGFKFSEESIKRLSESKTGIEKSEETKKKISQTLTGFKHTEETIQKMKNKKLTPEHKEKIGEKSKNHKHTLESKEKMSIKQNNREKVECPFCKKICSINVIKRWHFDNCIMNPINVNRDLLNERKCSMETRKKMGENKKKKPKLICPYCNKQGGSSNMRRYHFENCKYKNKGNIIL